MNLDAITDLWDKLTAVQAAPDVAIVAATAIAALAVVFVNTTWRLARNVITIAHEGGHALVALMCGRRLHGIRLHGDTSGVTITQGQRRGLGATLTLLAGYLFPAIVGLFSAWLVWQGRIVALLWVTIVLLAAMALFIRNLYGALAIVATGFGVFAVAWWAAPDVQAIITYATTWFLLIGSVRPVWEVWAQRSRRGGSDPEQLAEMTRIPAVMWVLLFAVVNVGSLALGTSMLLPDLW
ncbi:M50 family metallopeptidase [Stackebrandtia soli]|uniref:M50 family metallopeptidase n=1 Tax=Stackebrandtia soli TaxID=1892856 RepID=UPI0039E97FFD